MSPTTTGETSTTVESVVRGIAADHRAHRGALLPILRLHRRFGVAPTSEEPAEGVLIVVESARKNFCVLVDELIGKQEVVIKSLGETFKNVTGIAGGSILGDGRVGLILDVEALFGSPTRE